MRSQSGKRNCVELMAGVEYETDVSGRHKAGSDRSTPPIIALTRCNIVPADVEGELITRAGRGSANTVSGPVFGMRLNPATRDWQCKARRWKI